MTDHVSYADWLRRQMQIDSLAMDARRSGLASAASAIEQMYRENLQRVTRRWNVDERFSVVVTTERVYLASGAELIRMNVSSDVLRIIDPAEAFRGLFTARALEAAAMAVEVHRAWLAGTSELPLCPPWNTEVGTP